METLAWVIMSAFIAASGVAACQVWRLCEAAKAELRATITAKDATIEQKQAETEPKTASGVLSVEAADGEVLWVTDRV